MSTRGRQASVKYSFSAGKWRGKKTLRKVPFQKVEQVLTSASVMVCVPKITFKHPPFEKLYVCVQVTLLL